MTIGDVHSRLYVLQCRSRAVHGSDSTQKIKRKSRASRAYLPLRAPGGGGPRCGPLNSGIAWATRPKECRLRMTERMPVPSQRSTVWKSSCAGTPRAAHASRYFADGGGVHAGGGEDKSASRDWVDAREVSHLRDVLHLLERFR